MNKFMANSDFFQNTRVSESDTSKGKSTRDDGRTVTFRTGTYNIKGGSSRKQSTRDDKKTPFKGVGGQSKLPPPSTPKEPKTTTSPITKPSQTPLRQTISQDSNIDLTDRYFFEEKRTGEIRPASSQERKELMTTRTKEEVFGQDTKPSLTTIKNIPGAGFEATKKFSKGAVQSLKVEEGIGALATTSKELITGEKTFSDLSQDISDSFINNPLETAGAVATGFAVPSVIGKFRPKKAPVVTQKGKISSIKSDAFPEGLSLLETEDVFNIQRGNQNIKAVSKGRGIVKQDVDDLLLGTIKKDIDFFEDGQVIGRGKERSDFNIKDIDGEIRSEGTTASARDGGNVFSGRFQSIRQQLPDDSFLNRIVSGTKKSKLKGDPTDINTVIKLNRVNRPDSETIGFQKQQFEITKKQDIELEIAPGIRASKEATFTKQTDLTSSQTGPSKKSIFETDFLKRQEIKNAVVKDPLNNNKKSSSLLGPKIVSEGPIDLDELLKKGTALTQKNNNPQSLSLITENKKFSSTINKVTTSLPSNAVVDLLPPQPTQMGFVPLFTSTTPLQTRTNKRQQVTLTDPLVSSSSGPSQLDLSRDFVPPTVKTKVLKAEITPFVQLGSLTVASSDLVTEQDLVTQQSSRSSSRSRQSTNTELDLLEDVLQTSATRQQNLTITRQNQLAKQRTMNVQQSIPSLIGSPFFSPTLGPSASPPKTPLPFLSSQGGVSLIIGKEGNVFFEELKTSSVSEAINLGFRKTKATPAASFSVFKGGEPVNFDLIPGFRKSKIDKGRVVQKREQRIQSIGELQGITSLGISASKKSRKKKKQNNDIFNFNIGGLF